jgi:hypothetical protein
LICFASLRLCVEIFVFSMLEKPDIQDEKISACLQHEYGLPVVQVVFLPLGADLNTAVYRVVADDGKWRWRIIAMNASCKILRFIVSNCFCRMRAVRIGSSPGSI